MVGAMIFVLSMVHTLMHLLNFGINVLPDPVKFLQLTGNISRISALKIFVNLYVC